MIRTATLLMVTLLVGCGGGIKVNTIYNPRTDFSSYQVYDWKPGLRKNLPDPRVDSGLVDSRVKSSVTADLQKKGYVLRASGKPDFLIAYHVALKGKFDSRRLNYHPHRPDPGGWEVNIRSTYEQGTLILDMVDAKTERLIWRGTAKARVRLDDNQVARENKVHAAVKKLLKKFPKH